MSTDSWSGVVQSQDELVTEPKLEKVPCVRDFEVWCRLKKSSKYYHQGLVDPTNPKSKARTFRLGHFTPLDFFSKDAYTLHFNSNAYRIEDVELFLVNPKNTKNCLRIV